MNVQWESRSDAWRTPPDILDMVREVFGGEIDFDPATSELANAEVRARSYMTKADDALTTPWGPRGCIYLNPPGGKLEGKSLVRLFWRRLMEHSGQFDDAIFAMFSVEGLQTTQGDWPAAMEFPFCIPRKRVRWILPGREDAKSPSHSNAFVYVPGRIDHTQRFLRTFQRLGKCAVGAP